MWLLPFSERVQAVVFGGPSYFAVKQAMVSNVSYTESYPFDTAQFTSVASSEQKASKFGFNAGAEVSYYFSEHVGVGGLLRVSRGTVEMATTGGGPTVAVKAGGTHMGAGLRFRF
jgi:hypothetical protein